jgi:hypothetical protein
MKAAIPAENAEEKGRDYEAAPPRLIRRAKLSVACKLLQTVFYPTSMRNEAAGRRKQSSGKVSGLSRSRTI